MPDPMVNGQPPPKAWFWRAFSEPIVGLSSLALAIVGLVLAVFFYYHPAIAPDLVYYVNPARTVLVKQGTASRLAVTFTAKRLLQT
jgi:hypothetical protein